VVRGTIHANGQRLTGGDALKATDITQLTLNDAHDAEVLVFDLPGTSQTH